MSSSHLLSIQPQDALKSVTPLNEANYGDWKFQMQARLMQSTISWLVVKGEMARPVGPEADDSAWILANLQAAGLIYNAVSPTIQPFLRDKMDNSKAMWDTLKSKFEQKNATSRFLILSELLSVQKQPEDSLSTLIGKVDSALLALRASNSASLTLESFQEELAYSALIRALPDEFASFRSSLLLAKGADIDYDKVKTAFLQEEQARQASAAEVAMRASAQQSSRAPRGRGNGSSRGGNSQGRQRNGTGCTYPSCRSKGSHSIDNCFAKQRDKHAAQLRDLERKLERARMAGVPAPAPMDQADFAGNASAFDFTDPHSPLMTEARTDWIADTGATRHMTPHRHWFHSYTPYRVAIRLADNKIVHSTGRGVVHYVPVVNGKPQQPLAFHDVLHVPALRSNLLSVRYLTRNKGYNV